LVWVLDRQVRFDLEQVRDSISFLVGKLPAKPVGVDDRLSLRHRHLTKIVKGAGHNPATIIRERSPLIHGPANLPAFGWGEPFHGFVTLNKTATLLRGHIVQLVEPVS
jgi:hypothetical protein